VKEVQGPRGARLEGGGARRAAAVAELSSRGFEPAIPTANGKNRARGGEFMAVSMAEEIKERCGDEKASNG
jgi:hypothetical protein